MMDLDRDPSLVYPTPTALALDPMLDRSTKLRLLRRWRLDALRLEASEAEGMTGGERSRLGEIERLLDVFARQR